MATTISLSLIYLDILEFDERDLSTNFGVNMSNDKYGILAHYTMLDTPEQNKMVEKRKQHL